MSPAAIAYETFDIASERPHPRERAHPEARTGNPRGGPVHVRALDDRGEDVVEVTIKTGTRAKLRRLRYLYNATFFGTMPMTYVHPDLGTVLVRFEDPEELTRFQNYAHSSYVVRLRVLTGGYG